jgi:asparagine synthase (glutamine-hydrolysing)
MCGIIGVIGMGSREFIELNIGYLRDRGPDSHGILHLENGFSMGATRLAMTDPKSRSNQPMKDSINQNVIVFNGEIYNFHKIKKELADKETIFHTESDTEVLMKAISEYGIGYVKYFEGMFAFGYYDQKENSITLARDYLGKKPLYYANGKDFFIFSSKISLIKKYLKSTSIDNQSLSIYLRLGYVPNPNTMFKEIKSLEPGEILKVDLNSTQLTLKTRFTPAVISNPQNVDLVESLEEAVTQRTFGHDSFALSMSGGIDSSIIAIIAARQGLNCNAYSMGWKDSDKSRYNYDSKAAELISKKLGLNFQRVDVPGINQLGNELDKFIKAMEEPNANPSGLSMMALYKQISIDGLRLVLTGDGSDEIFGGYSRYQKINRFDWIPKISHKLFRDRHFSIDSDNELLRNIALALSTGENLEYWFHWQQIASTKKIKKLYAKYEEPKFDIEKDSFFKLLNNGNSRIALTMGRDLRIWLAMESNSKLDRVSMAHSIEARSPFQSEIVIGKGFSEMLNSNFRVLNKQLLVNRFPQLKDLPLNKEKMGFISPLGHWLRNNKDLVFESTQYLHNHFDFNFTEIEKLSKSPNLGLYQDFSLLWALIVLARWHHYAHN